MASIYGTKYCRHVSSPCGKASKVGPLVKYWTQTPLFQLSTWGPVWVRHYFNSMEPIWHWSQPVSQPAQSKSIIQKSSSCSTLVSSCIQNTNQLTHKLIHVCLLTQPSATFLDIHSNEATPSSYTDWSMCFDSLTAFKPKTHILWIWNFVYN